MSIFNPLTPSLFFQISSASTSSGLSALDFHKIDNPNLINADSLGKFRQLNAIPVDKDFLLLSGAAASKIR